MTKIPAASGLIFADQYALVERIATAKAYQYSRIGFYDFEDLKQEVRIKCWSVIDKYDPSCGANPFVFLSICAENRLKDIRRSIMYKHNKPCLRCPFWNKEASASGQPDCRVYLNKIDCEKYRKHERYVTAKLSASRPTDIETQNIEDTESDQYQRIGEIVEIIEARLPEYLLPLFKKFQANNFNPKCMKSKEKALLLSTLKSIISRSDFN